MIKKKNILRTILALVIMLPCMLLATACGNTDSTTIKINLRPTEATEIEPYFEGNMLSEFEESDMHFTRLFNLEAEKTYTFSFTKNSIALDGYDGYGITIYHIGEREGIPSPIIKTGAVSAELDGTDVIDLIKYDCLLLWENDTLSNGTHTLTIKFETADTDVFLMAGYFF